MSDNMKKFLELVSQEDDAFAAKVNEADQEGIIALAKEKGIDLTAEDFDFPKNEEEGEVDLDEADAVAGGDSCRCVLTGNGKSEDGKYNTDRKCKCIVIGAGHDEVGNGRCYCVGDGSGKHCNWNGGTSGFNLF